MKKLFCTISLLGIAAAAPSALFSAEPAATPPPQENKQEISNEDMQKISEAFGHFIGRNINIPGIKFDLESVIKGIRDGAQGKPAPLSEKEYEEQMLKLQRVAIKAVADKNLKAADEFMEKNKTVPNIIIAEPGKLQYLVLEQGHGPVVEADGNPLINYKGTLLDGTVFGSSEEVGNPITLPLSQTIPGFSRGIQGMKEGEKRRLFIHPDLGYGTNGHFPPNSLLIFDVEVVKASSPKINEEEEELTIPLDDEDDDMNDLDDEDHGHVHASPKANSNPTSNSKPAPSSTK